MATLQLGHFMRCGGIFEFDHKFSRESVSKRISKIRWRLTVIDRAWCTTFLGTRCISAAWLNWLFHTHLSDMQRADFVSVTVFPLRSTISILEICEKNSLIWNVQKMYNSISTELRILTYFFVVILACWELGHCLIIIDFVWDAKPIVRCRYVGMANRPCEWFYSKDTMTTGSCFSPTTTVAKAEIWCVDSLVIHSPLVWYLATEAEAVKAERQRVRAELSRRLFEPKPKNIRAHKSFTLNFSMVFNSR